MAMAPARPCPHPKCGRLVVGGGRCSDHQRPSAHQRGYTAQWTAYAPEWLRRFPYCGMRIDGQFHTEHSACVRRGLRTLARIVDHIQSIADGGDVFDPHNHQSLCVSCNTRKG